MIVAFFSVATRIFLQVRDIWGSSAPSRVVAGKYESDCERCAALCCVVLAFDRSELFACDKPALVPCSRLRGYRCAIHTELEPRGFAGCAAYDCYGAGPRVVREVFGGRSWREDASLVQPMAAAFSPMREIQELGLLLELARDLPLGNEEQGRLDALASALEPPSGWSSASLADFERGSLAKEVSTFLRSLSRHVPKRRHLPLLGKTPPESARSSRRT